MNFAEGEEGEIEKVEENPTIKTISFTNQMI